MEGSRVGAAKINYSQSWEDIQVLRKALSIQKDDSVLSITSGGDNSFALLLDRPAKFVTVDMNAAQNDLFRFKREAALRLEYAEFLECIEKEVLHVGKFERFLATFRRFVLPLIHSRRTVGKFLGCKTIEEQKTFYHKVWNSWRWRFMFRLVASRGFLKRFARQQGMFAHQEGDVGAVYLRRFEAYIARAPVAGNYFLRYCLTGNYGATKPPYLEQKNFNALREALRVEPTIVTGNILEYLRSIPAESISKYYLSDLFEALSDEVNEALWEEIVRTARKGAVVAYWNNLVPRSFPASLVEHVRDERELAEALHKGDQVFFYGSFHVNVILK